MTEKAKKFRRVTEPRHSGANTILVGADSDVVDLNKYKNPSSEKMSPEGKEKIRQHVKDVIKTYGNVDIDDLVVVTKAQKKR